MPDRWLDLEQLDICPALLALCRTSAASAASARDRNGITRA